MEDSGVAIAGEGTQTKIGERIACRSVHPNTRNAMSEYNDTNVGMGHAYDSPEDKEIERLEQKLKTRDSELTSLREQVRKLTEEIAKRDSEGEELAVTGDHNLIPSYEVELAQLRAEVEKHRSNCCLCGTPILFAVERAQLVDGYSMHAKCWRERIEGPTNALHTATARIAELELSLAIVGDMAVADWNDEAVGIVDAQVKEPLRYKDQLRSMFAARDKCVELQADNLRLHRLLAQFTGNA